MGSRLIVSGTGNNNYEPDREITRAEFATIVVRALGLRAGSGTSQFPDVTNNSWYAGFIQTAVEYGLINGYETGNFGPNDAITREQAMTIIARAMNQTKLNTSFSSDQIALTLEAFTMVPLRQSMPKQRLLLVSKTESSGRTAPRSNRSNDQ
jgi:hypothetical protein